ncbi:hypothetical protein IW261DRAFT_1577537 [Armillaria novae-zelandiae]|uniref:Uncharacterized protein n=1 Tax=Armillaria novae-zelandiae TaxID=153914 RepID=A0AA39N834_9AGAR|nr:hypothetical protein IW261DRAFT_1577537 [Armillaria novae-zelandiae]
MTPSRYPPLHIAPLPSAESSDVSLLDDYDGFKPQTHASYGSRRRISIVVIVPGILIFIACAGLASSLSVWLQSRRVQSHIFREDPYFLSAIVAIEGTRAPHRLDDGSLESDMMMYDNNNPPVGAAGCAHCTISSRFAGLSAGVNYGLLVKLCRAANIFSAYETVQYLKRGRERRSPVPSGLIFAFTILVLAIVLNHLLSAADLWLHTTASTFIHTSMTEIHKESMPAVGTKINLTTCAGPRLILSDTNPKHYCNCASCSSAYIVDREFLLDYWGDRAMIYEGLAVARNSSSTSRSVMVDDMVILVPSTMPDNVDNLTSLLGWACI